MSVIGLVLLMAVSFCYAMFQGGFVSWFIFYSFLPFSVYALILLVYPLHDFTVERKVNKRECQAGESVEIALRFTRKNRLPLLFMVVEEELPQKMEDRGFQRKIIIFPGFKRTFSMSYILEDLQRGEHSFQSIRFWIGDFFGLVEKEAIYSSPLKITVFPRYHELGYSDLDRVFNQGAVVSAKKTQREHSVVSGVREYQPGDQLSWINWKATARTSEIMTKEFEVQKNRDVFIMLDEKPSDLFEESIEMAASIAHALLKKGMEIGYVSRESRLIIPAAAGNNQKRKIFYQLVKEEPRVANDLNENVRKGILPANAAVIFIVSDLTLEKVDILSALRPNLGLMLCVKKQAYLTDEEKLSSSAAVSRGIKVRFFEHGQLKSDRSEVMAK
ncbi:MULTISPECIES: DUF58 domain-containing protein [Peribacillus]|uniref:DUF58 domain-containing protein n=1 Tax=Peribacillus TaxID=2675229 RepID=UPI001F4EB261|nr:MULTISPECIES: DUF58 domain-containing protein [unclassified Peribacillus]MCK1986203.1 DUF58 domain-containing protein [Peribacillus sp. Aquil_B1]MCK2011166.1 DUF58 domain-containing protein [Peribacillus sp. Aquil_B8]